MHLVGDEPGRPLASVSELRDYFASACKPRQAWRLGTEHEIIGVHVGPGPEPRVSAPPYDGERGIGAVLDALTSSDWQPVREDGHIIALTRGDAQVTIEPGGQLELAARPVHHADEMRADLCAYVRQLAATSKRLGITWLGVGFRPFTTLADVPWMPKQRYAIMREYLPTRGRLAHEMMKRTATVQVNIDYSDPAGAAEKLRAILSVTSVLTAIFANSPIVDAAVSGYQSYRSRVWEETDPDRCGLLDFVFDGGDIFDAYTRWALDIPMFFVHRKRYLAAGGMTFGQFLAEGWQGHQATMDDWALHLSTLFPEARMKKFIEVRGCDSSSMSMVLALAPLCRGLFYDDQARRQCIAMTASLTMDQRRELARDTARSGLAATIPGSTRRVGELARELVALAEDGLRRTAPDELDYLEPVRQVVQTGRTQADAILDAWRETGGDPARIIPRIAHRELDIAE